MILVQLLVSTVMVIIINLVLFPGPFFDPTIMLLLLAFSMLFIVLPSAPLSAQGLDRGLGIVADMFTLLPPLPILFLGIFTSY